MGFYLRPRNCEREIPVLTDNCVPSVQSGFSVSCSIDEELENYQIIRTVGFPTHEIRETAIASCATLSLSLLRRWQVNARGSEYRRFIYRAGRFILFPLSR
jgi:hypothetical protein